MDTSRLIKVVEDVAPYLGTAIASVNPMAGILISLIGNVFGANSKDPNDIVQKIQADPNAAIKLRQIQTDHFNLLDTLHEEAYKQYVSDKMSARQREEKIIELTGKRDWVLDFIAILFIIGFFLICGLNYFYNIKDDHVMTMLIGQFSAGVGLILAYYFGSSNK